jgi:hypothetical protein
MVPSILAVSLVNSPEAKKKRLQKVRDDGGCATEKYLEPNAVMVKQEILNSVQTRSDRVKPIVGIWLLYHERN